MSASYFIANEKTSCSFDSLQSFEFDLTIAMSFSIGLNFKNEYFKVFSFIKSKTSATNDD